jgi:hypothetical protein
MFALGLGPLLGLAVLGLPALLRGPKPGGLLILVWVVVSLALMYAPVAYQRRFAFGLQPMLAVAAAFGLERAWHWSVRSPRPLLSLGRRCLAVELLAVLFAPTVIFYGVSAWGMTRPMELSGQGGAFQAASLREAGRWLATAMEPTDVILGEVLTGNYLAGVVPGRVFVGHPIATLRFEEKAAAMRSFYHNDDQDGRRRFLAANNVHSVVYGSHEHALGVVQPIDSPYLHPVFDSGEVRIFAVQRSTAHSEGGQ